MKIFISWSGKLSNEFSIILGDWLNCILPNIPIFISSLNLTPGARWSEEIAKELEQCNAGIICLTNENLMSPWINFEAGALSKHIEESMVIPLLVDVENSKLSNSPLSQFQTLPIDKKGFKKLLLKLFDSLNLNKSKLDVIFDKWWGDLETKLNSLDFPEKSESSHEKDESSLTNYNMANEELKLRVNQIERFLSNLTKEETDIKNVEKNEIEAFCGLWENPLTGTLYYGFLDDKGFYMPYLYGNSEDCLAHFYNIKIKEKRIYGEFEWLKSDININGYFFLDIINENSLKGGWVYSHRDIWATTKDIPNFEGHKASFNFGTTELILDKVNIEEIPSWVEEYKDHMASNESIVIIKPGLL